MTDLALAVGEVKAIVTGSAEALRRVERRQENHEQRIVALETDRAARERANTAAREAVADERANEDRWGKYSPRAIVLAGLGAGGLVAVGVLELLVK